MTVTAIMTNKGGVGKTTFACNLAHQMSNNGLRVLLVDADPQCNATILMKGTAFLEDDLTHMSNEYTSIHTVMAPVARGDGYHPLRNIRPVHSEAFGVDMIHGSPRLALYEDLLAGDWARAGGGDARGIRTTLVFTDLIEKMRPHYDEIIVDCGPALGSINRSVLIAADRFISPVGPDLFSKIALDNMGNWMVGWRSRWANGLKASEDSVEELQADLGFMIGTGAKYAGYVLSQISRPSTPSEEVFDRLDKASRLLSTRLCEEPLGKPCLGTLNHASATAWLAQSNALPLSSVGAAQGMAGAAFSYKRQLLENIADITARIANPKAQEDEPQTGALAVAT